VVSFIFADLIALPLLFIYRRYYGTRLTLRMVATFWTVMSIAGLVTQGIFGISGLVPTTRPAQISPSHFEWNYTTYLNIIFLVLFSVLYWAYRHRDHLGGVRGYALDPVCGMQVETARAPATAVLGGERIWFCSDRCLVRFEADPVHPSPGEPQPARVSRGRHGRRSIWATSPTDPSVAFGPPGSLGSAHRPHNLWKGPVITGRPVRQSGGFAWL
jgi:hypothetical protein